MTAAERDHVDQILAAALALTDDVQGAMEILIAAATVIAESKAEPQPAVTAFDKAAAIERVTIARAVAFKMRARRKLIERAVRELGGD